MCPARRSVLKVAGGVGLGGAGVAYWQRRESKGTDYAAAAGDALAVSFPTVPDPVTVTDAHVEAAYSWARNYVERTERELPGSVAADSEHLAEAKMRLSERVPIDVSEGTDRRELLSAYADVVGVSAMARGNYLETDDSAASDEFRTARETLGDEIDAFEPTYTGASLTGTIVQAGHAETCVYDAVREHQFSEHYLEADTVGKERGWEHIARGQFALRNAEWFREALATDDAVDQLAALETCHDRLEEHIDSVIDNVDWEYEPGVDSSAPSRWTKIYPDTVRKLEFAENADRLARAAIIQAEMATLAETLAEFEDVPGQNARDERDIELLDEPTDLAAEKRTASDRLAATADAIGSDPLGAHLLREAIQNVEQADSSLERLREHARSDDHERWQSEFETLTLRYRGAAADADAIPAIVSLVADQG